MSGVALANVTKRYGETQVIHGVDLDIEDGEFCVFVGPSGCGKSTLLRMIAGLEAISGGDLQIGGARMNEVDASERGVAMVFQTYALYPHMTVEENMGFGLRMAKRPKEEIASRVGEAARVLQLDPYLQRKPAALSGGQRQRVAIGRAIVRQPGVFLFDEPLSNLDAELRVAMRIELARLHGEIDATMIYVTHDQVEAMTLADKIVVLRAGRVEQVGSPLTLYDDPDNLFVAGFIGSPRMNFFKGRVEGANGAGVEISLSGHDGTRVAIPISGEAPAAGAEITLGIRPDWFRDGGAAELPMTVEVVEHLGGASFAYATGPGGETAVIETHDRGAVAPGAPFAARFDPARALLFGADEQRIR